MTRKTSVPDARGVPTKVPGWFSWRHATRGAHDAAVARYLAAHGRDARRARAAERKADFDAEVARVAHEQNISGSEARRVVTTRRHFEFVRGSRKAVAR